MMKIKKLETELWCSQTDFWLWIPPFLSYELWKQRIELWKKAIQITSYYHSMPYKYCHKNCTCSTKSYDLRITQFQTTFTWTSKKLLFFIFFGPSILIFWLDGYILFNFTNDTVYI